MENTFVNYIEYMTKSYLNHKIDLSWNPDKENICWYVIFLILVMIHYSSKYLTTVKSRFYVKSRIYVENSDDQIQSLLNNVFQFYVISRFYDTFGADQQ